MMLLGFYTRKPLRFCIAGRRRLSRWRRQQLNKNKHPIILFVPYITVPKRRNNGRAHLDKYFRSRANGILFWTAVYLRYFFFSRISKIYGIEPNQTRASSFLSRRIVRVRLRRPLSTILLRYCFHQNHFRTCLHRNKAVHTHTHTHTHVRRQ